MRPPCLTIGNNALSLADLRRFQRNGGDVAVSADAMSGVERSQAVILDILRKGKIAYGINTGFGSLARTHIDARDLTELQRRLVLSHSVGVGALLEDDLVRLILLLKIVGLARGYSGVRPVVIERLVKFLDAGLYPCVPSRGSVGASGDLAPLAHLAAPLIGEGYVRLDGEVMPALAGLAKVGLSPLTLAPKEGLALLNGTQVSTALALSGLFAAEDVFASAIVSGAMSVDAAQGSDAPFDPRIHAVRGQHGQIAVAAAYRRLLAGSAIRRSHIDCDRVQDPYSLRCQPQVMGACLDTIRHAAGVIGIEANAVSDNPLIFAEEGEVLSGGNFHAEPIAFAADMLALALAEIGALAERRIALLIDRHMSGLPAFLVKNPGLNSGFMIAHVTAAALASENKSLAHPASVDSLPTSANQEDHVSMATYGALRLRQMAENSAGIVGIELLAAAQGIEFHAPYATSAPLAGALARIRALVASYEEDRFFAPDIEAATGLVRSGAFSELVPEMLPSAQIL
jgi:histidine ammonia-lyase